MVPSPHQEGARMNRLCLLALLAALSAACGTTTSTSSPGAGGGGSTPAGGGGGSGTVVFTAGDVQVTLTDATCTFSATYGTTVLAGSRAAGDGQPDGISLTIPSDNTLVATISGSAGLKAFALGPDARGSVSGHSGSWSGTDIIGTRGHVGGTFTCP
jgi:hypothetical protein